MTSPQAGQETLTYHHALFEGGQHWFSAECDGDEVAHAYVIERQGPGGPHAEITRLWTNPHERGRGIGSHLLDRVSGRFKGQELRLKPYPIDEEGGQDESELRDYYSNRGFRGYELREGDPVELYDYMTKPASPGHAAELAGSVEVRAPGLALAPWTAGECPAREDPHPPPARRPRQRRAADRRPSGSPAARLGGSR